jgi:hypothetical protein
MALSRRGFGSAFRCGPRFVALRLSICTTARGATASRAIPRDLGKPLPAPTGKEPGKRPPVPVIGIFFCFPCPDPPEIPAGSNGRFGTVSLGMLPGFLKRIFYKNDNFLLQ